VDEYASTYGWSGWPFRIIVDKEFAKIWADRSAIKAELARRLRRLRALPHGTVQLLWADFGAGKSHTLRHMELQCERDPERRLLPAYTEIPVQIDGLQGLFQRLAVAVPEEALQALAANEANWVRIPPRTAGGKDLRQALRLLGSSDSRARAVATEWLVAQRGTPHLNLLRSYGINGRIEDEDRIVEVVAELVKLVLLTHSSGLIWFVDEFQRIADLPARKRESLLKAMVSLFNACPAGLHLVLSFSVAQQATVAALLPPDLQSRAMTFPMLTLPFLSRADAVDFLQDLFKNFQIQPQSLKTHPFLPDALDAVVEHAESNSVGLTPRKLMELTGELLFNLYDENDGNPAIPLTSDAVIGALNSQKE